MGKSSTDTPLMKQYASIKSKYPDALLLFRVGDFYETFGEDAIKASKILDITLTKRSNGAASNVELAGFPHHSLDNYLPKLVRAGLRVAICDQLEDPKLVKGIVKRGVTELVTPGVSMHDMVLDVKRNNYLASICPSPTSDEVGLALLDISTGEFLAAEGNWSLIEKLISSFSPSEIIAPKYSKKILKDHISDGYHHFWLDDWSFASDFGYEKLVNHFKTQNLKGFGIDTQKFAICAAGAILQYLEETEHKEIGHIAGISRVEQDHYVWMDKFSVRNLELIQAQHEGGVPLLHILDKTCTPMGTRMLRKWLSLPLKDISGIQQRLQTVEKIISDEALATTLKNNLTAIGDLERLISKVAVRRINPRELLQLKRALHHTLPILEALKTSGHPSMVSFADRINPCLALLEKITHQIHPDPPAMLHQGGIIADGVHEELDELRKIAYSGKDFLIQLQQEEIKKTGISSLKVAYNKVFGYYLEVTHTHRDRVPSSWIRKQTLVNAERYITEELKIYEEKILNAEEKITSIEQRIYQDLVHEAAEYVLPVQENARVLASVDVLRSLAEVAVKNNYSKPKLDEGFALHIEGGRHPVIECQLPPGETYVANDVYLDTEQQQIMVITGPNMAGKSALLRQVALITLMAQIGSYVPAKSATVGLVDKIFTRVGASDNLSKGESTFMVEMTETASILNNLSERSLILMDEIGRGTSTYDGISIAWSIVEYLHNHTKFKPKTLFATHYHELNELAKEMPRVKNYNVAVKEVDDKVIFLRILKPGGCEHSFGIHVAQMSGMPNPVVIRAAEIMHHLEKDPSRKQQKSRVKEIPTVQMQLNIFEPGNPHYTQAMQLIEDLDINRIAPVEALLKLNELKKMLQAAKSLDTLEPTLGRNIVSDKNGR